MEIINEDWETWFTSKLQVEASFYAELCRRIKIGRELGRPIQRFLSDQSGRKPVDHSESHCGERRA